MGRCSDLRVSIVGTEAAGNGGIAQYVTQQRRHLSGRVRLQVHSLAAVETDGTRPSRVRAYVVGVLRSLCEMVRFTRLRPSDVVHVHTAQSFEAVRSAFYVLYASVVWGSAVVLHVHGSRYDEFVTTDSWLVSTFQQLLFSESDSILVISEYWRETLSIRVPSEKLFVLPNAVTPGDYDPAPETDPPEVLFLSYHTERKGVGEFRTAVEQLNARSVAARVHIAGDGPLADESRSLARDHENVTYHGYVSESKKRRLYERSSVFVLPSHAEGVPLAILEAMAGGTAVVSTPVGGIPEVVTDDRGVLVPTDDPDALTDALASLLEDPDRIERMAERSRSAVESRHAWDTIAECLVDHYAQLVEETTDVRDRCPAVAD